MAYNNDGAGKKKYNIAYLTRQVDDNVSHQIWSGIVKAAKDENVNMTAFIGDVLGKSDCNIAYQLCRKEHYDGIITWATSEKEFTEYYGRFKGIPLLSLSLHIEGYPVVSIDCYSGMKDALNHLINEHGFKKIGFIRGPENHIFAKERYQAYLDIHKLNDIPFDESRIVPSGTWLTETGSNGIKFLLDEKKLKIPSDLDAVAGANDYIIIGAIEELKKRGYKVPNDIGMIGFNNTPDAESFTPPVSSVMMPYYEQGQTAVKTMVSMIEKKPVKEINNLNSSLIVHRSCGCKSMAVKNVEIGNVPAELEKSHFSMLKKTVNKNKNDYSITFNDIKDETVKRICDRVSFFLGEIHLSKDILMPLSARFIDAFIEQMENEKAGDSFLAVLEEILVFLSENSANIEAWHGAVSVLRQEYIQVTKSVQKYMKAQDLFEQARVTISEIMKRFHIFNNLQYNKKLQSIRQLGSKLITTFNLNKLVDELSKGLKNLGFPGFYLVLYDKITSYKFPDPPPDAGRIILAYNEKETINLGNNKDAFKIDGIISDDLFPVSRNYCFVLSPLYFEKKHIGYIVLEVGPVEKNMYSALVEQLSSALMGSILMEESVRTEKFLETTLDTLQNKAKVVSTHSQKISMRVEDVSAAMEEMAANIRQISNRTEDVMVIVDKAVEMAGKGSALIKALNDQSKKISEIIQLINNIAEKTSILALNANIEAARAREAGRGFKIVAEEVKKLSTLTVKSTEEIGNILESIGVQTNETYEVINGIVGVINKVSVLSDAIKDAVSQQVTAANEVSNKLIETAYGSKEIFEAIKEVAYTDESGAEDIKSESIAEKLKKLKSR